MLSWWFAGVGVGFAGFTDPDGRAAFDGTAIGAAPQRPNPEMIISAQPTSQARRPLLAGRTAPRSRRLISRACWRPKQSGH